MSEHGSESSEQIEPTGSGTGGNSNPTITERELRKLHRQFIKSVKGFNELKKDSCDLAVAKGRFNEVEMCYAEVLEPTTVFKSSLNAETDQEKIEDIEDKLDLITQQYELARNSMNELEEFFKQQQAKLIEDLRETSHKNNVKDSIVGSTTSYKSSRLFDYSRLTPQERIIVAESKLQAAALQVDLAKKLAAVRTGNVDAQNGISTIEPKQVPVPVVTNTDTSPLFHGGSQRNADYVDKTLGERNINDTYLAGKMLIESGTKVQFDGNPKNYITFRQGMERVLSMHGPKYGLVYDILQSRCTGKATEAIRFCDRIKDPELAVKTALERLQKYFGDETAIVEAHINSITQGDAVKWTVESFQSFLNELEDVKILLGHDSRKATMNSPNVIKGIISRMPRRTRDELVKILCETNQHLPKFEFLLDFVERQLKIVSHPLMNIVAGAHTQVEPRSKDTDHSRRARMPKPVMQRDQSAVKSYAQSTGTGTMSNKCPVIGCTQSESHPLWACSKFNTLSHRDKWAVAKKQSCCYKCLNPGHCQAECQSKYCCRICKNSQHHYLLCPNGEKPPEKGNPVGEEKIKKYNVLLDSSRKLLPIVSVKAINSDTNKSIMISCLLDTGCDTTMGTKRLAKELGLKSKSITDIKLVTTNAESYQTGFKADVTVENCTNGDRFSLADVIFVDKVAVQANYNNVEAVQIAGLEETPLTDLPSCNDGTVDMIIGVDNEYLHDVSEIRRSAKCNIAAKLSKIGWALVGHLGPREAKVTFNAIMGNNETICQDIHSNNILLMQEVQGLETPLHKGFICNGHADSCELLHAEIDHYFNAEFAINVNDEDAMPSIDDNLCTKMYDESVTKREGRYYLKLPKRTDSVKLPSNREQAKSRLLQQRNLMRKDSELKSLYVTTFQKLIDTDKIEAVDAAEIPQDGRTFYIPHFITQQSKKRLVYDGSAQCGNVSLNSVLFKGCDNLQRLSDVLLRFRRFKVAFSCDIKEMFMQCGIWEEDRDYLRILWFEENNIEGNIKEYRFKRLPFGLNCSMSMADYCLRKTAEENEVEVSAETVEVVKSSFYVDDGLVSCKSIAEGKKCVNELIALLHSGGFELRKFVSENDEILSDIDPQRLLHVESAKEFADNNLIANKVLGMRWNPSRGTLSPRVDIRKMPETKRGLWATTAQIFDPLGICAAYLLPGRIILQEVCLIVKEWDNPIPPDLLKKWRRWLAGLPCLERLEIPRCYWADDVDVYELHTFCDSSEKGLGCVSYLRMIKNCSVHVAFVMAKAKVVPKGTTMSIPRLELIAATIGSKMHWQIKRSLHLPLSNCCLYTDSAVVMDWLRNTESRLKKWVARRVTEINRLCGHDEWLKVPTAQNAADVCSRGNDPRKADANSIYIVGPSFLHEANSRTALNKLNATGHYYDKTASRCKANTVYVDYDNDVSSTDALNVCGVDDFVTCTNVNVSDFDFDNSNLPNTCST